MFRLALLTVLLSFAVHPVSGLAQSCVGDCGNDGLVTVDELVQGISIALGQLSLDDCPQFDDDGDRRCTVDELVTAVNNALSGCVPEEPTSTPTATSSPQTVTPTPGPEYALDVSVTWDDPVEPPQESFAITIEIQDPDVNHVDWVLGDVSGDVASGRLNRGVSATVRVEIDWSERPLLASNQLFYVHARGDDGSTFARVVTVNFSNPATVASPTPTPPCGYASFAVTTESDLSMEYPDSAFVVEIANQGLFQCGNLNWWIIELSLQQNILSCSPSSGLLGGALNLGEPNTQEIECSIDWSDLGPGEARDYFLVLFSYPLANGIDSAHLIRVRATKGDETPTPMTPSDTPTQTLAPTDAATATATETPTQTPTVTDTLTASPTETPELTRTGTFTPTWTPPPTETPTNTPTRTSTACAGDPPAIHPVTPQTDRLTQRVSGCGRPTQDIGGSHRVWVNGFFAWTNQTLRCPTGADWRAGSVPFEVVVDLQPNQTNQLTACQDSAVCGSIPCTGEDASGNPIEIVQVLPPPQAAPQRFAYVVNEGTGSVLVINTNTNEVQTTIVVPGGPQAVVITPDGRFAYVGGSGSSPISVIDTATSAVTATIPFGHQMGAAAISPDGTYVYLTDLNFGSEAVSVLDTTLNQITATIPLPDISVSLGAVAVRPDGRIVYAANGKSVSVIDTATHLITSTLQLDGQAEAIAVSPDGAFAYVTHCSDRGISVIDAVTNALLPRVIAVNECPFEIAITPDGSTLYTTHPYSGRVSIIDTASDSVTSNFYVGPRPEGVAVSPWGNVIYVTIGSAYPFQVGFVNVGSHTVTVIDTATNSVIATINADRYPAGVAMAERPAQP